MLSKVGDNVNIKKNIKLNVQKKKKMSRTTKYSFEEFIIELVRYLKFNVDR